MTTTDPTPRAARVRRCVNAWRNEFSYYIIDTEADDLESRILALVESEVEGERARWLSAIDGHLNCRTADGHRINCATIIIAECSNSTRAA